MIRVACSSLPNHIPDMPCPTPLFLGANSNIAGQDAHASFLTSLWNFTLSSVGSLVFVMTRGCVLSPLVCVGIADVWCDHRHQNRKGPVSPMMLVLAWLAPSHTTPLLRCPSPPSLFACLKSFQCFEGAVFTVHISSPCSELEAKLEPPLLFLNVQV